MARALPYRARPPAEVATLLNEVPYTRLYVLREPGPTSFVLRDDASPRKYKVSIGETHTCSCHNGNELCLHILFVLVRVFRMPVENPLVWQRSLTEREIAELMRGRVNTHTRPPLRQQRHTNSVAHEPLQTVTRRELGNDEVCPICYDVMTPRSVLTFCREGCGSNVHTKCMKLWADNRVKAGEDVTCPMCRSGWGVPDWVQSSSKFRLESRRFDALAVHHGVSCNECAVSNFTGSRFKCMICNNYDLCARCFETSRAHRHHPFVQRENLDSTWVDAERPRITDEAEIDGGETESVLDISLLTRLPVTVISDADDKSSICGVCSDPLRPGQVARQLPCGCRHHQRCVDRTLSSSPGGRCPNHAQRGAKEECGQTITAATIATQLNQLRRGKAEKQHKQHAGDRRRQLMPHRRGSCTRFGRPKHQDSAQPVIDFAIAGASMLDTDSTASDVAASSNCIGNNCAVVQNVSTSGTSTLNQRHGTGSSQDNATLARQQNVPLGTQVLSPAEDVSVLQPVAQRVVEHSAGEKFDQRSRAVSPMTARANTEVELELAAVEARDSTNPLCYALRNISQRCKHNSAAQMQQSPSITGHHNNTLVTAGERANGSSQGSFAPPLDNDIQPLAGVDGTSALRILPQSTNMVSDVTRLDRRRRSTKPACPTAFGLSTGRDSPSQYENGRERLLSGQRACGNAGSTRRPHGRLRAQSASAAESSRRREVEEITSGWEQLFIGDAVKNCDVIPSSKPSKSLPASRRRRNGGGNGQDWRSLRRNSVGSRPAADNLTAPIRANVVRDQHNLHADVGAWDMSNATQTLVNTQREQHAAAAEKRLAREKREARRRRSEAARALAAEKQMQAQAARTQARREQRARIAARAAAHRAAEAEAEAQRVAARDLANEARTGQESWA